VLATYKTSRAEFFKSSKTSFLVSDCLIVEHRRISSSESLLDSDYCCIRLDFYISGVISTTRNLVSDSLIVERVTAVAVISFPNRNRRLRASIFDCLRSFCSSSHRFYDRCETQSCDRPRTVTVEQGPKREKWWDGCGALVSLDSKLRKN
jgi:hypothetical protein